MIGLLGLITGGLALFLTLSKKGEAAPPESYIPTAEEISSSQSTDKLNAYYDQLSELYISGVIDYENYMELWSVYEARYNELIEGS